VKELAIPTKLAAAARREGHQRWVNTCDPIPLRSPPEWPTWPGSGLNEPDSGCSPGACTRPRVGPVWPTWPARSPHRNRTVKAARLECPADGVVLLTVLMSG
jgi:hypothetical protein